MENPPGPLYHYTTAAGLVGILESTSLRATHFAFLNDVSEAEYAARVVDVELSHAIGATPSLERRAVLSSIREMAAAWCQTTDIFITSFSSAADDLGQWRGYGSANADRYCLAFDAQGIRAMRPGVGLQFSTRVALLPVVYEERDQRQLIREVISREFAADRSAPEIAYTLRDLLPQLKDPAFASEREWRSATTIIGADPTKLGFCVSPTGVLRPFAVLTPPEGASLPLLGVSVLASTRREQAAHAARLLLQKYGYFVDVTYSSIPFVG